MVVAILGGSVSGIKHAAVKVQSDKGEQAVSRHDFAMDSTQGRSGSTLTLRVKKGDVDDFAKGTLSLDDFTKKVAVAAY